MSIRNRLILVSVIVFIGLFFIVASIYFAISQLETTNQSVSSIYKSTLIGNEMIKYSSSAHIHNLKFIDTRVIAYLNNAHQDISKLQSNILKLKSITDSPAVKKNAAELLTQTELYLVQFDAATKNIDQIGVSSSSGLVGQINRLGDEIDGLLLPDRDQFVMNQIYTLRLLSKQILFTHSLEVVRDFDDKYNRLVLTIGKDQALSAVHQKLLNKLDSFRSAFHKLVTLAYAQEELLNNISIISVNISERVDNMQADLQSELAIVQKKQQSITFFFSVLLFIVSCIVILTMMIVLFWLYRAITRSINRLKQGSDIIGAGDLSYRVDDTSQDEMGNIAKTFNQLVATLQKRMLFEHLLSLISTKFISINSSDMDKTIKQAMNDIGKPMGFRQSFLFLYDDEHESYHLTHSTGTEPQLDSIETEQPVFVTAHELFWLQEQWAQRDPLVIPSIAELPFSATQVKLFLEKLEIANCVAAPLKYSNEIMGFLLYVVSEETTIEQENLSFLKMLSEIFVQSMRKNSIELELLQLNDHLEQRVDERTNQLHSLNQELMATLESLQHAHSRLVQTEKLVSLGQLVSGIAHEINTPIGIGLTAISHLEKKVRECERLFLATSMKRSDLEKLFDVSKESATIISFNLERASELIQSFKRVSVDQSSEARKTFAVKKYMREILISLKPKMKTMNISIEIECDDSLIMDSFPGFFSQVMTNLLMNSLIHAYEQRGKGTIRIDVKLMGEQIELIYADDGKGILPDDLKKVFDPFFTTRRGKGGTGLGLHVLYLIITQKLAGTVECFSEIEKGTTFVIRFPQYTPVKAEQ